MQKACSVCYEIKTLECFYNKTSGKFGKEGMCKQCKIAKYSDTRTKYYKTYQRKRSWVSNNVYNEDEVKLCSTCQAEKPLSEFYYDSSCNIFQGRCKSCISDARKSDVCKQKCREWKTKRRSDPGYRLLNALCSRIWSIVKGKANHSNLLQEYIGCSLKHLKQWLAFQFEEGMTFDNYGSEWHVDHVRPCASFDLFDIVEVRKCTHWTNLRPCWRLENIKKSAKILPDVISNHELIVLKYKQQFPSELH
jgi:hypothetical protein